MFLFFISLNQQTNAQLILEEEMLQEFEYRALGPYRAGSWITEIVVPDTDLPGYKYTFYIGSHNGGVWKTENNGITFKPIFDSIESISIGAIAIAKTNPDFIWVGTGEAYNARSSYSGTGIYKSIDGGLSWQCM